MKKYIDLTKQINMFLADTFIDETIEAGNDDFVPTYIQCFGRKCHGIIETALNIESDAIHWRCATCSKGKCDYAYIRRLIPIKK